MRDKKEPASRVADEKLWTVYELVNESRREIYVGRTTLPVFRLASELSKSKPKAIAGWDLDHATTVRTIEFSLREPDALSFIAGYCQSSLPTGWKYLSDAA